MRFICVLVISQVSYLAIGVCASVQAQTEPLVPRVAIEEEPVESVPPARGPVEACQSPAALGYQAKRLNELSMNIRLDEGLMPADCATAVFEPATLGTERHWAEFEFNWAASDLFHQPAYFDDPILERYGQSNGPVIQPILSGAHFFSQFPLMPYKIGIDRTHDHVYTLGYYRPGSPTPLLGRRLPLEADAASFEAMTWVALFLILP